MPGLRNENYQTRNVMGAVTGLPGVGQRGEGISAATRLASDQAVIRMCIISSVDPSDLMIMPDIRDDMFRPGAPSWSTYWGHCLNEQGGVESLKAEPPFAMILPAPRARRQGTFHV